jgi:hypothetical protein
VATLDELRGNPVETYRDFPDSRLMACYEIRTNTRNLRGGSGHRIRITPSAEVL